MRVIGFRTIGVRDALPDGIVESVGNGFRDPAFPFWQLGPEQQINLVATLAILVLVTGTVWVLCRRRFNTPSVIGLLCVVAAIGHFLFIALILGLVLTFRYGIPWTAKDYSLATKLGVLAGAISAGWIGYSLWLTYGVGSRDWIEASGSMRFLGAARRAFVWPDPGVTVLAPWFQEFPLLAGILVVALLVQFILRGREPLQEFLRNPAFLIAYVVVVMGLFAPRYSVSRYTFFVYPVALAMFLLSVRDLADVIGPYVRLPRARIILGIPLAFILFASSRDFSPRHLTAVSSFESTYRLGEFRRHRDTWYSRWDYASVAAFVSKEADLSDPIVVVELPPVSYYMQRDHAVFFDRNGGVFASVSRERGRRYLWSSQRLLSMPKEVRAYAGCRTQAWLVRAAGGQSPLDPELIWGGIVEFSTERLFLSPDGRLEVLVVTLSQENCSIESGV